MSLWLLSQSLPPMCRPSTVEVQRWSKWRCHGQCLKERRRAAEQKSGIQVSPSFLGLCWGWVLMSLCGGLAGFLLR